MAFCRISLFALGYITLLSVNGSRRPRPGMRMLPRTSSAGDTMSRLADACSVPETAGLMAEELENHEMRPEVNLY
jgi:hypothetical protein